MKGLETGSDKKGLDKLKKAGTHIAAFLAGALSTQIPAVVNSDRTGIPQTQGPQQETVVPNQDTYSSEAGVYEGGSASYDYEFPATKEALQAVIGLDETLGQELKATDAQRARVRALNRCLRCSPPRCRGQSRTERGWQ